MIGGYFNTIGSNQPDAMRRKFAHTAVREPGPLIPNDRVIAGNPPGCCAECVCMPTDPHAECAAVPCLLDDYRIATTLPFSSDTTLTHDTGCIYVSDSFGVTICDVDYGTFHWKLTVSDDPHGSTLELVNDGTGDDLPIIYKTYKAPFNPICGNTFAHWFDCDIPAEIAHLLPCEVCVVADGDACEECEAGTVETPCGDVPQTICATINVSGPNCPAMDGYLFNMVYQGLVGDYHMWHGSFVLVGCGTYDVAFGIQNVICDTCYSIGVGFGCGNAANQWDEVNGVDLPPFVPPSCANAAGCLGSLTIELRPCP